MPRPSASRPALLDRQLLFVTGKGGVGRTTVAASLALLAARQGKRTLVCAMEPSEDLGLALECGAVSYAPKQVAPRLSAMQMDTEAALREYLRLNLHVPTMGRLGPMAEAFDFVATAAPGVREILTVGKLCYEVRERHFDLVVVDASATGHIIGHLAAPVGINELVQVGAIRDQTRWMRDILEDPLRSGVAIVTTPEETPVNEALELVDHLEHDTSVPLAGVIANRLFPELFGRSEEDAFERVATDPERTQLAEALGAAPELLDEVLQAARIAVRVRRGGAVHLERLRQGLADSVPLYLLPFLFARSHGPRAVHRLADALEEELGS